MTSTARLFDQDARDAIRHDLETTLVVEAAAGTGKTTELVCRVLGLLRSGKGSLARLVMVTFTEKAAGEMKLRLREEIERQRGDASLPAEEIARLDGALPELEAAHISTIHGFCADLLRERPVEAKVDPLFEVAADEDQARLLDDVFDPWLEAQLGAPSEGVRRVLRRRVRERDAAGPRHALRGAAVAMVDQRDFDAPWRREPFDRIAALDHVLGALQALGALGEQASDREDWLTKGLLELARWLEELRRREAVRGLRDHDGLEAELRELDRGKNQKKIWEWKGRGRRFSPQLDKAAVLDRRAAVRAELSAVLSRCDADLAAALHDELSPLIGELETRKARAGKLDFLDLLVFTRDLLRDDRAVREELQKRFTHLLVDEFQDTDPLQAEILMLLAADDPAENDASRARPVPGKLFVVGDPKQSIYRFRRADVALYEATKQRLLAVGGRLVHLTTSFRSVPSIQQAVNAAFAPLMGGDGQASYVPLQPFRAEPPRPSLVALPVPRPYMHFEDGRGKILNYKIEESYPQAVGAFIEWLLFHSGWRVEERGTSVPVEARHVCLLFKRFQAFGQDATRPYLKALEARRVPHVLVGGRSYHAREEVLALRNVVSAVEWPEDELAVFATLRGPFFALGDDALLAYRVAAEGSLHPYRRVDAARLTPLTAPVAEALAILRKLHAGRNRRPIADTVVALLEATRAHAGVAIWPTGEQALANVFRVLDLARRFESRGTTSFRAFVQRLQEDAERGGAAEAPVVEEGTEGVRMMTVHRAKGLEFPVVVLVDPTANATPREPSRYADPRTRLSVMPLCGCTPVELLEHRDEVLEQDRQEAQRLVYVAATRARDLLVVPVCGDSALEGWLDPLTPVVYPAHDLRRAADVAPGCPAFGGDSVRDRPAEIDPRDAVKPGLHRASTGEHGVVWWDPHVLDIDKEHDLGLRQQRILMADDGGAATEGERLHDAWRARRTDVLARGSTPSIRLRTATELATSSGAHGVEIETEATDVERAGRPHGKRFGTLVHAVLAAIELDAAAARVLQIAQAEGRLVGATAEEVAAAAAAAEAALRHPLLARARAPGVEVRRECPLLVPDTEGTLIEGVLDLAFREPLGGEPVWTVIDFKTDVELGSRQDVYARQLDIYVSAVASVTGERARGVLLAV